ncbi:flagellar basal-body rod protein FlgG [Desulfacinum hydrothermale DSM 13146]|uniref:Flagellar basal-body rod protein FlgG n=1 Tax=Desulfacinum hydrothermale DSM 13146 TaxID=1121390 RepID=A0A1W1X651_9BACT|nr:flagellar hook basal-body protein [Desulfacinum hydrothermale]SMC19374.1 flagellar basal-body rod protein FlgG [Desulfacinum hydrothermale DSM 13146]
MRLSPYTAVLGAIQEGKKMDVVANNLANAATPGYRKEAARFSQFMEMETYTKTDPGPIHRTGNPWDIAIRGRGYLRVQTDKGERYTRAGNLTVNDQGQLVTQDGWPVLGQGGVIELTGTDFRVDPTGQVYDGEEAVDMLDVVIFPPGTQLRHEGSNLLVPTQAGAVPMPAADYEVEQGALEGANFSVVEEMTHMIETSRVYETCQKIAKASFEEDKQIISQLGKA